MFVQLGAPLAGQPFISSTDATALLCKQGVHYQFARHKYLQSVRNSNPLADFMVRVAALTNPVA